MSALQQGLTEKPATEGHFGESECFIKFLFFVTSKEKELQLTSLSVCLCLLDQLILIQGCIQPASNQTDSPKHTHTLDKVRKLDCSTHSYTFAMNSFDRKPNHQVELNSDNNMFKPPGIARLPAPTWLSSEHRRTRRRKTLRPAVAMASNGYTLW